MQVEEFNTLPRRTLAELVREAKDVEGLVLEFGVASGSTVNQIARAAPDQPVYGFDWFKGLPEDWRPGIPKGAFACNVPDVRENVELVHGLFQDTVDAFLAEHPENVKFIHIDVDIYSSAKFVLDKFNSRFQVGTIVVFDELYGYPGFEEHEWKAVHEWLDYSGWKLEALGGQHHECMAFRLFK
jgi:hypothetical protein